MSHKLTPSKDGHDRLELVVKSRFTLVEMATFIASNFVANTTGRNEHNEILIDMKTIKQTIPNKKTAISIAQEVLLIDGTELPSYRIGDNNLEELRDQVLTRLKQLWAQELKMSGIGSHKLRSLNEIKEFVFAGRAIFTVVNTETGNRLTFRFSKPRDRREDDAAPLFAGVLSSYGQYSFIGTIFDPHDESKVSFVHSRKSRIAADSVGVKTIAWIINRLKLNDIPETVEFWHEGRCGRCSKMLTVPESIENGLGPVCIRIKR